jgi:hypothetical protein
MGVNQQTSVPAFTVGQVLTAQQQTEINTGVPVFADTTARDAAFGGTGEKTLAEGQLAYLEDSDVVQYYDGSGWARWRSQAARLAQQAETSTIRARGHHNKNGRRNQQRTRCVRLQRPRVTTNDDNGTEAVTARTLSAGGAVTPAVGITVTVGAGGTAGTSGAAGGSGYVWIEYQV